MKMQITVINLRFIFVLIFLLLNPLFLTAPSWAKPQQASISAAEKTEKASAIEYPNDKKNFDYKLTLEQLGARHPINLRGIDGSDTVLFNVRSDELVKKARLSINFSYSPALLSELSHINVIVNDEIAATVTLPREEAGKNLHRIVELPAHLITEFNRLRLQLVGHYTLECEDPLHSSLWAVISNKSQIELMVEHLPLPNDLSILPTPFFDHRDNKRLQLPFLFLTGSNAAMLESAGMVASWFGALAGYRGAAFSMHTGAEFPESGNAIAFIKGSSTAAEGMTLPLISGPTLAIMSNPKDSKGKVLLIMGRDDAELKHAAQALVMGSATFSGASVRVNQIAPLDLRKPYDAPNWLRTDRPVKFGEILDEKHLNVSGHNAGPVRVPLRLPPDLFGWRAAPVKVDLRYHYTPQQGQANSSMLLSAGDQFIKSFHLHSTSQILDKSWLKKWTHGELLPVQSSMETSLTTLLAHPELQFKFVYDVIKQGECRDTVVDNVRGRIDPDSSIDLTRHPHFMPLPDLGTFGKSGFPFTRMADLSETAVVFSESPSIHDVSTYLTLLGRFGESTGYPATAITVSFGESGLATEGKDLVIIASGEQKWLSSWTDRLPAAVRGQTKRLGISDLAYKERQWLTSDPRLVQQPIRANLTYSSEGHNALFTGFESPVSKGRSVVLISSSSSEAQKMAAYALLVEQGHGQPLQGSLAVVQNNAIHVLAADYTYSIGNLGIWRRLEWNLARYWPDLPSLDRLAKMLGLFFLVLATFMIWRKLRKRTQS